jgi:hypothetical protein
MQSNINEAAPEKGSFFYVERFSYIGEYLTIEKLTSMKNKLLKIIRKKISRAFLILWPPYGEDDLCCLDLSFGIILEGLNDQLFVIGTDINDLTTPSIDIQEIPVNVFQYNDFEDRINNWMICKFEEDFEYEYYEISYLEKFKDIIGSQILDIELLSFGNDTNPYGLKMIFENDFIISTPSNDGNCIETKEFALCNNLANFKKKYNVKHSSILD